MPSSGANQREESSTPQAPGQSIPSAPSGNSDSVPSMRGPSDPPRNSVALVIPVMARYQQVSLGERSATGLDGVHQPVADSSRQPQSAGTPVREGSFNIDLCALLAHGLVEMLILIRGNLKPVASYIYWTISYYVCLICMYPFTVWALIFLDEVDVLC